VEIGQLPRSHHRDIALRIGGDNVESDRTAVVQRHAGSYHGPGRSLAHRRDDMIIRHDQPTGIEDDTRANDVVVDTANLQRDDTRQHLRRDALYPVGRGVGRHPRMGAAGRGHRVIQGDRVNHQNDGQCRHRCRHRHCEIPQQFEGDPNQSLPQRVRRRRPVGREPTGGLRVWPCRNGTRAMVANSTHKHHPAAPSIPFTPGTLAATRTSNPQVLSEVGCYSACRDSNAAVLTGNTNCDTRLVGVTGVVSVQKCLHPKDIGTRVNSERESDLSQPAGP
jgi:hypothetical protein